MVELRQGLAVVLQGLGQSLLLYHLQNVHFLQLVFQQDAIGLKYALTLRPFDSIAVVPLKDLALDGQAFHEQLFPIEQIFIGGGTLIDHHFDLYGVGFGEDISAAPLSLPHEVLAQHLLHEFVILDF